jgi:hypothetical protein
VTTPDLSTGSRSRSTWLKLLCLAAAGSIVFAAGTFLFATRTQAAAERANAAVQQLSQELERQRSETQAALRRERPVPPTLAAFAQPPQLGAVLSPETSEEGANSAGSATPTALPEIDHEALASEADEEQRERQQRRREAYQLIADDLDARRYDGVNDTQTYTRVRATLSESKLPIAANSADDGCSEEICSFALDVAEGPVVGFLNEAQRLLRKQGFSNVGVFRLANGKARLFATRAGIPLKRSAP